MNTIYTRSKTLLADAHTPVGLFLKFRDLFAKGILLESSEKHHKENSFSYLAFDPLLSFSVQDKHRLVHSGGHTEKQESLHPIEEFRDFIYSIQIEGNPEIIPFCCLLGFTTHNAIPYFEDLEIKNDPDDLPEMFYSLHRYMLVFDHFKDLLHVISMASDEERAETQLRVLLEHIEDGLPAPTPFELIGPRTSDQSDASFIEGIQAAREHCFRGDVFQMVLSRAFYQNFTGDDFNVYRHLRSINPSPYLFYFDYGSFRLMGSSPESQIQIKNGRAHLYPIAGTFKRSGQRETDERLAKELFEDPKERSEHVMLVDLARNDLSRNGDDITVEKFKDIVMYSHVIHMESEVSAKLKHPDQALDILADTFPAGTLSGAPKFRALQLIDQYEDTGRGFYGGAIGWIRPNGEMNQAIMIRSILSKQNQLTYRAGAGVVAASDPKSELREVYNKLQAVEEAIQQASKLADLKFAL